MGMTVIPSAASSGNLVEPEAVVLPPLPATNTEAVTPTLSNSMSLLNLHHSSTQLPRWRQPLQHRTKTVGVAIVMCLHIGVDPPDLIRPATSDVARMECWIDPLSMAPDKARETIARTLQQQYEYWQPRARYKAALDPTCDDVKRLVGTLRKGAKGERLLLHYNGHGVPKPTRNGELWLFNKQFTQYIPMHIRDLYGVMDGPSMFVFDCSSAGHLHAALLKHAPDDSELIILSACSAGETLPVSSNVLPMDLFTSCLTTPMEVALRVFPKENQPFLPDSVLKKALDLPGRLNDRSSVLGELNWILTAITDSIAWQLLDDVTFQRLFRQDLLVAALFKNFLLACRVMRHHGCTPISNPPLPVTLIANHHLWHAWAYEVDRCLTNDSGLSSRFFLEQRLAFDCLVKQGEQGQAAQLLPIVLQLLLSQTHRPDALNSFHQFMSSTEAIEQVLTVGLFPYILKLLSSPAMDIKRPLLWCWLKVFMFDETVRQELCKDEDCLQYFIHSLFEANYEGEDEGCDQSASMKEGNECRVLSLAILCRFYQTIPPGGLECVLKEEHITMLLKQLRNDRVSVWKILLISVLYDVSNLTINPKPIMKLLRRTDDPNLRSCRWLRRAAVYCMGRALMRSSLVGDESTDSILQCLVMLVDDSSKSVREEVANSLSVYISLHFGEFTRIAYAIYNKTNLDPPDQGKESFVVVWRAILCLAMDPVERVSRLAGHIIDEIHMSFMFPAAIKSRQSTSLGSDIVKNAAVVFVPLPNTHSHSFDDLLVVNSNETKSRETDNIRLLHTHIKTSEPRVELESVLPVTSTVLGEMLSDLASTRPSGEETKSDKYDCLFGFELDDARRTLKQHRTVISIADNESPIVAGAFSASHHNRFVCADSAAQITIWQYNFTPLGHYQTSRSTRPTRTNVFSNGKCGKIRSLKLSGQGDDLALTVSSSDGCIRVWRDFDYGNEQMASAWSTSNSNGAQLEVLDDHRLVYSENRDHSICTWDLEKEHLISRRTFTDQPVKTITAWRDEGLTVLGFADGKISLLDERVKDVVNLFSEKTTTEQVELSTISIIERNRIIASYIYSALIYNL